MRGAHVASGWYPDPSGRHTSRFWDGREWQAWVDGESDQDDRLRPGETFVAPVAGAHRMTHREAVPPLRARPEAMPTPTGGGPVPWSAPPISPTRASRKGCLPLVLGSLMFFVGVLTTIAGVVAGSAVDLSGGAARLGRGFVIAGLVIAGLGLALVVAGIARRHVAPRSKRTNGLAP
jgi:uncharacterized protein DUF2510